MRTEGVNIIFVHLTFCVKEMPYFCEDGIQIFNYVVFVIYTFVLLFRILVVVAAFFPPNEE
jgi:hypothetical protein